MKVLVVEAGPAGAATALLLARQGITVTLVERETSFRRVFRGEGLMPLGLDDLLDQRLALIENRVNLFNTAPDYPLHYGARPRLPSSLAEARAEHEVAWNSWNGMRAVRSSLALLALIGACLVRSW